MGWLCRCDLDWVLGLSLALARLSCRVLLRRLRRRDALEVAAPLGFGPGTWPLSRVGAFIRSGAAAAASPPGRSWLGCAAWDWAGCVACVSRWCVYPVGCCCGGYAAGALLGWLCPYNLGEHCTAPADMLQLHGTLPASFPLINNRPLSERAAGASRRGSGGAQTFPYGCAATGPHIAGLWHGKAYTRVLRGLGAARRRICADGICACLSQMYLFIIRK